MLSDVRLSLATGQRAVGILVGLGKSATVALYACDVSRLRTKVLAYAGYYAYYYYYCYSYTQGPKGTRHLYVHE